MDISVFDFGTIVVMEVISYYKVRYININILYNITFALVTRQYPTI